MLTRKEIRENDLNYFRRKNNSPLHAELKDLTATLSTYNVNLCIHRKRGGLKFSKLSPLGICFTYILTEIPFAKRW